MNLNDKLYREIRCRGCKKLIAYEYVYAGRIAFSCPRCGELNEFEYKHFKGVRGVNNYTIGKGGEK